MERLAHIAAPIGKTGFLIWVSVALLVCGVTNRFYHFLIFPDVATRPFKEYLVEGSFTALPVCVAAFFLIQHLFQKQRELYRQSTVDSLTKLTNRRWFMDNTPLDMEPGHILMIADIDHFKRINDRFGHDIGDLCLRQMAIHLQISLGYTHNASRIGGEEFAALLSHTTHDELIEIAERIAAGFTFKPGVGIAIRVTASVGISICRAGQTRAEAFRDADFAVYDAKENGRARYAIAPVHGHPPAPSYVDSASVNAA